MKIFLQLEKAVQTCTRKHICPEIIRRSRIRWQETRMGAGRMRFREEQDFGIPRACSPQAGYIFVNGKYKLNKYTIWPLITRHFQFQTFYQIFKNKG